MIPRVYGRTKNLPVRVVSNWKLMDAEPEDFVLPLTAMSGLTMFVVKVLRRIATLVNVAGSEEPP